MNKIVKVKKAGGITGPKWKKVSISINFYMTEVGRDPLTNETSAQKTWGNWGRSGNQSVS